MLLKGVLTVVTHRMISKREPGHGEASEVADE